MIIMSNHHENLVLKTLQQQDTNNVTTTSQTQSIMHSSNSDFPIAVAVLAIMAVALLLASYYIFVIKCCLNWQNLDPLRRFSISRARGNDDDPLMTFSPMVNMHRGLDEWLINNLPAYQYKSEGCTSLVSGNLSLRRCAVCLTEFQEQEILRVLPKCSHTFHLDCIDVWLMNNASCPLCRSSISGRTKYPIDQIIAPSSSPQELLSPFSPNLSVNFNDNEQDYLVIELGEDVNNNSSSRRVFTRDHFMSQRKTEHYHNNNNNNNNVVTSFKKITRKSQRMSIMGDECINIRPKDEQFFVQQPIRRSISMDSAADRGLYLQVQEIIRRNNEIVSNNNEVSCTSVRDECNSGGGSSSSSSSSSNGRVRKSSFFSFGHGRGSRSSSSILPINCDR